MEFASRFILANDEDEFESLSDEEFEEGMHVSGSGSDDDGDRLEKIGVLQAALGDQSEKKKKKKHHWRSTRACHSEELTLSGVKKLPVQENKSSRRRRFRKADTNVVSVNFSTLLSPSNMHAGDPVVCSKCSAILSHLSKIDTNSKVWQCEFCGEPTATDIEPEEAPTTEDVTYLIEPAMATSRSTMSGLDQSLVVFCVDTSGSMCVTTEVSGKIKLRGTSQLKRLQSFNEMNEDQYLPSQRNHQVTYISRLQAMQAAVDHQLGEMAKNHPNRRVALVTFNNEVTIVGDGSQAEITIAGDRLTSEEQLCKAGAETPLPQAIKSSRKCLGEKVYQFEEGGATALGPALIIAINMAAHHPGSKVILCTDGKANIGMGKLEDVSEEEEEALDFYTKTAECALSKGVTISVITIQGTDCKLVHLGMLADKTGGQVNIVDPLKLTEEFGTILADPIIATKVQATFLLHQELYVIDDSNEQQQSRAEYNVGNVCSSTTITFEFSKKKLTKVLPSVREGQVQTDFKISESEIKGSTGMSSAAASTPVVSEFPFQLQIEYVDTEGNKALRVITQAMPATTDRKISEESANLDVLGTHAAKKSADLALQGQYSKSRGVALMNQRLAWRQCHSDAASATDRTKYRNIYSKIQGIENCVNRMQMTELNMYGRTRSDSEPSDDDDDVNERVQYEASERLGPKLLPSLGKRQAATKFKKIRSQRTSEMDDDMANMMYRMRSYSSALTEPTATSSDKGEEQDCSKVNSINVAEETESKKKRRRAGKEEED